VLLQDYSVHVYVTPCECLFSLSVLFPCYSSLRSMHCSLCLVLCAYIGSICQAQAHSTMFCIPLGCYSILYVGVCDYAISTPEYYYCLMQFRHSVGMFTCPIIFPSPIMRKWPLKAHTCAFWFAMAVTRDIFCCIIPCMHRDKQQIATKAGNLLRGILTKEKGITKMIKKWQWCGGFSMFCLRSGLGLPCMVTPMYPIKCR